MMFLSKTQRDQEKCESGILKPKVCDVCGFATDDVFVMVCPRCMNPLPGPTSCSGGCGSCRKK